MKNAFFCNRRNPTNANAKKIKAQSELNNAYLKEQTGYIPDKINKIRDLVEDKQSRIAWQTVNEVSRRKSTLRAKLNAASQKERIHLWKHFKNLLGKSPKVKYEPIMKIISNPLDIKLEQSMPELGVVPRKIKNWKAACLDEILQVGKTRNFD